jgi:transcription elongation GreA/GreB family factor
MKHILEEDLTLLNERVATLEQQIFALGEDFNEAVNQSSETWHDNAPFDVVRDRQTLLTVELRKLRIIRAEARKIHPKKTKKVAIGSKVELIGPKTLKLLVGGNWVGREKVDGYTVITCESPIGKILMGKKLHDTVELPLGQSIIGLVS